MKEFTIGVANGSFLKEKFEAEGLKVEATDGIENSIKKLKEGRIDLFIDEQVATYDAINKIYPTEKESFKALPKLYNEKAPNGIMISRKYKDAQGITKKFNKGLGIIKNSGEYEKIIDKYKIVK